MLCFSCAVGLAACNTYDSSLLLAAGPPANAAGGDPTVPDGLGGETSTAGGAGASGEAGETSRGGTDNAGGVTSTTGGNGTGAGAGAGAVSGGGATGGGGHGGTATQGGTAGSSGNSGAGATLELIDDFEDQDQWLLPVHKRNGPWYVFNDGTKTGKEEPLTIALLGAEDARAGSVAALHLVASGFTAWGAGVGADFINLATKKVPYDVSAYQGIHFFAKVKAGSEFTVKLLLPTIYSDPVGGQCDDSVVGKKCNDHLFCTIPKLTAQWAAYQCAFADFTQQGFGLPQTELDPRSVYSLQFTFGPKLPTDVWIDDVAFVLK